MHDMWIILPKNWLPVKFIRKYENLSDYENLWMIIHIDVYLFVTPYKREIPLMKIYYIIFSYSNLSLLLSSSHFILQQK